MNNILSGIYQIKNIVNNHLYIGSAINVKNRKSKHFSDLKKNKHHSIHLQRAYNLYNENNFGFYILEYVEDASKLIEREQYYIDNLKPQYNICKVAGSSLGKKHSEETKKKMSELKKGKYSGEKNPNYGKICSDENKKKKSEIKKGKNNPMYGRKHSEETRKKMSQLLKGKYSNKKHPNCGKIKSELAGCPSKKVICVETNIIYKSITESEKQTNICRQNIKKCCSKKRKTAGKLHWEFYNDKII